MEDGESNGVEKIRFDWKNNSTVRRGFEATAAATDPAAIWFPINNMRSCQTNSIFHAELNGVNFDRIWLKRRSETTKKYIFFLNIEDVRKERRKDPETPAILSVVTKP